MAHAINLPINYENERQKCESFLSSFEDAVSGEYKYLRQLQALANRTQRLLEIDLADVYNYHETNGPALAADIEKNVMRYKALFEDAVDKLMPAPTALIQNEDIFDVLMQQRVQAHLLQNQAQSDQGQPGAQQQQQQQQQLAENAEQLALASLPPALRRRYQISFKASGKDRTLSIRTVHAEHIGKLITVAGIVTRVTDVKPEMAVATYTCDSCGKEIYQEVTGRTFKPLQDCPTQACKMNSTNARLQLQTRASKMIKFQEIRIQERPQDVPVGHIPRSMIVHVHGELTRQVSPGDVVVISGSFLPVPKVGFRAIRAGLVADTYLEAMHLAPQKRSAASVQVTEDDIRRIDEFNAQCEAPYFTLARSVAPEIHGHEDVKKALLLQLCGAPLIVRPEDGLRIRGDVHVCLMGDPGVAKSQLLKFISHAAPRAVYTTGKGSSGVGLTAAVVKDSVTGELVLEGGALVLADMGVCCIDEFDKMDEHDRTAIHEVMEQQTVSISKAGIQATLNARASVLAAANPLYGRYNRHRSPAENINLPAALLSRFDLLFILTDDADMEADVRLARHVTAVHRTLRAPGSNSTENGGEPAFVSPEFLRSYVAVAKSFEPQITPAIADYVASTYVEMRQHESEQGERAYSYTTARTLLSILRLAQAFARCRFSDVVEQFDIDEAIRLMDVSKAKITQASGQAGVGGGKPDSLSLCYSVIRDYARKKNLVTVQLADIKQALVQKGITEEQMAQCIAEYEEINVWTADDQKTSVTFVG